MFVQYLYTVKQLIHVSIFDHDNNNNINNNNTHKTNKYRSYLFSGKWFSENYFPNFPVFVCYQESWSTKNTFQSKENLAWFPGKCFLEKFGRKTLFESCEKFRNVILFANYIKFDHKNF